MRASWTAKIERIHACIGRTIRAREANRSRTESGEEKLVHADRQGDVSSGSLLVVHAGLAGRGDGEVPCVSRFERIGEGRCEGYDLPALVRANGVVRAEGSCRVWGWKTALRSLRGGFPAVVTLQPRAVESTADLLTRGSAT
jgi:hypothetical protein